MKHLALILLSLPILASGLETNGFADTLGLEERKRFWQGESSQISTDKAACGLWALACDNEARLKQKAQPFTEAAYLYIIRVPGNRIGVKDGGSVVIEGDAKLVTILDRKGKPVAPDHVDGSYMAFNYAANKELLDKFIAWNKNRANP